MLRQWCPLLWCISHPKLLEVRDFVKTLMIRGWCVQTCWWLTASPPSQYHNPGGMAGGEAGVLISLLLTTQMVFSVIIKENSFIIILLRAWIINIFLLPDVLCRTIGFLYPYFCLWGGVGINSEISQNNWPQLVWNPFWSPVRCPGHSTTPLSIFPLSGIPCNTSSFPR